MEAHDAILLAIVGLLTAVVGSPVFVAMMARRERSSREIRDHLSREEMTRAICGELHRIEGLLIRMNEEHTGPIRNRSDVVSDRDQSRR